MTPETFANGADLAPEAEELARTVLQDIEHQIEGLRAMALLSEEPRRTKTKTLMRGWRKDFGARRAAFGRQSGPGETLTRLFSARTCARCARCPPATAWTGR